MTQHSAAADRRADTARQLQRRPLRPAQPQRPEPVPEPEQQPPHRQRHAMQEETQAFYLRHEDVTQVLRPIRERPWSSSGFGSQVWVLTVRSLRTVFGDFKLVFFGLLQPVVLLLLFSQVFKGVGSLPSVSVYRTYVNYLMPATLVNIAMTTAMSSGVGLLAEIYTGFIGRLRAMPINMLSVLVARTLSDAVRLAVQLVVIVVAAVLFLDFRPAGVLGITAATALSVVAGWGLGWLFVAIATWQNKPETMQAVSFIVMFPLMFASNAYMPVQALPGWLQLVAKGNPLTYVISAERELSLGLPIDSALPIALALVAAAALIGGFASARNFRRTR
ncbi:MAG TPA: ABC transporter permease [Pseudonocardiaceae bacterium]|nr:ABC transporter permease [Pseudonocardiaceae bacterium]